MYCSIISHGISNVSSHKDKNILGNKIEESLISLEPFNYLLSNFDPDEPNFPPTTLYNEGWLLRLVVDRFSKSGVINHPLSFPKGGHWFSEARIPSAFFPKFRGDPLAEAHTKYSTLAWLIRYTDIQR